MQPDAGSKSRDRTVETFEQNIVFRGARWVYLLLAVVAVVVLGGAGLMGVYGVAPVVDLGEPESPELVAPAPVDEARVAETLQRLFAAADGLGGEEVEYYDDGGEDVSFDSLGEDAELEAAIDAIGRRFDASDAYPWKDSKECSRRGWRGSCYRWKKKRGARTVLLESLRLQSPTSDLELVEMADKLVQVAPANDDGRFVYVGLFKDMMLATNGQPTPVVDAVRAAVQSGWQEPALLGLALGLIKSTTHDAGSERVVALINQAPGLLEVFGSAGMEQAVQLAWDYTGELSPADATAARTVMLEVAREVPDYQRWRVFDAWRDSTSAVQAEAERTNAGRMADWREEVAEYELSMAAAEANREAARASAVTGMSSGVLGICALGVLLAVLGVERNTRRTEALLRTLQATMSPSIPPNGSESNDDISLLGDEEGTHRGGAPLHT